MNEQKLSERARRVKDVASDRVAQAAGTAKSSASRMAVEALGVAKMLRSAPSQARDRFFPECTLPLFLLPTGSAASDFCCVFDFDEPIDVLRSHRFPRPVLRVWAGRQDFDRDSLTEQLKSEFTRQFEASRDRDRSAFEAELKELEEGKQKALEQVSGPLGSFAGTVAAAAFLDPGAIMGLIILAISMRKGRLALKPLTDYFEVRRKTKGRRKEMEHHLSNLEAQFSSDNKVFQRSVRRLDVQVHPELRDLARRFCQADGVSLADDDLGTATDRAPDIFRHLRSSEYLSRVPERHRAFMHPIGSGDYDNL